MYFNVFLTGTLTLIALQLEAADLARSMNQSTYVENMDQNHGMCCWIWICHKQSAHHSETLGCGNSSDISATKVEEFSRK